MNRLENWVMQEMVWHLKEMEGQTVYGCDLGFQLFEKENCDGSYTCNAYSAGEWIREYWHDLGGVVEEYEFNYGELPVNPFDNPEVFQVQIILDMASSLAAESDYIKECWNDEIELTEDIIEKIVAEWSECL